MRILVFLLCFALAQAQISNGDVVCAEGYVMDQFCIDRGTLLDNPSVRTLEQPFRHTVHCLVDVSVCINSGFVLLQDPETEDELYKPAWALTRAGTQTVVDLARSIGDCSTCAGNGKLRRGLRLGVEGTVRNAEANPPVIDMTNVQVVDADAVFCQQQVVETAPPTGSPTMEPTTTKPTVSPTWVLYPPKKSFEDSKNRDELKLFGGDVVRGGLTRLRGL